MGHGTALDNSPRSRITGLTASDLAATALFAFEGAVIASGARLDLFGVLVVACVSALGGGTARDLLIGDVPTASVRDVRYVVVSTIGGLLAFGAYRAVVHNEWELLVVLDAAGLALF
ncbi:MAG: TRIC cation channel family protein, partial [Microthrixaceae bacterium]|nr:TRIC cation channel family protein [Microthrixaceae bacterium]